MPETPDGILQRLDERTSRLLTDTLDAGSRIHALEVECDRFVALTEEDYGGLRRIIREEVESALEVRGTTGREWIGVAIAAIGLIVSIIAVVVARGS